MSAPAHRWIAVALAVAAAAFAPTPAAPRAAPPAHGTLPLPTSSIAAVLARRGDLGLSEREITRLEELERALERERDQIEAAAGPAGGAAPGSRSKQRDGAPEDRSGGGSPGGRGAATGGPGPGGMGGPGMRGGPSGPPGASRPSSRPPTRSGEEALVSRLDEADTRAYLKAEEHLDPGHRGRAREIAAEYRAAVYDERERLRAATRR